jgi:hypothetical protein
LGVGEVVDKYMTYQVIVTVESVSEKPGYKALRLKAARELGLVLSLVYH